MKVLLFSIIAICIFISISCQPLGIYYAAVGMEKAPTSSVPFTYQIIKGGCNMQIQVKSSMPSSIYASLNIYNERNEIMSYTLSQIELYDKHYLYENRRIYSGDRKLSIYDDCTIGEKETITIYYKIWSKSNDLPQPDSLWLKLGNIYTDKGDSVILGTYVFVLPDD